ncbi:GntR family transcriptional regulator [Saccharopolyspora sp. ASAGF58]|uniref:GntR family transcriptional regulator n=1 Tax=Saccharopolyspora sp. ASAGF58 TaxID=2719023 RepID=UPI001446FA12|nr:GntR family transcriptional regulator [Saccharopolyspora sp. ASAGF58]
MPTTRGSMAGSGEVRQGDDIARIRARRPLQDEIRDAMLHEFILSNRFEPGDRLPSEAELTKMFGASRVTIRTALQSLKDQGYIRIVRGSGSTVLPRPETIKSGIDRLSSFDTYATLAGQKIHTDDLEITRIASPAKEPLAEMFGAALVTKISRTKRIGDARVALIVDYVPEAVLPLEAIRAGFDGSVLDLLLLHGLAEYSDCTVTAVAADAALCQQLNVPDGAPLLQLSELTRDTLGKLVNRSETWLAPASFTLQLRRRREP